MSFIDDSIKRLREEEEERRKRERAIQLIREPQKASNSNTTNSPTSTKNSPQTPQTVSQSTPAEKALFKMADRKYTKPSTNNTIIKRDSGRNERAMHSDFTRNRYGMSRNERSENVNIDNGVSIKDRIKKDEEKKKFVEEHPTGEWLGAEAWSALTGLNSGMASFADFVLPDKITPKFAQDWIDMYKGAHEEQMEKVEELRGGSLGREIGGTTISGTLQAIPDMVLAMLSGGQNVVAKYGGKLATSLLKPSELTHVGNLFTRSLGEVAKTMRTNPMFWTTFSRTAGETYDNEVKNGASPLKATISAFANGLLNSQIEVGGGIETFDASEKFLQAVARSAKEEGLEEVQQYAVENLVNKAVGSNGYVDSNGEFHETPWLSFNRGENAVINPVDMAEQGFYGAITGGLLSGGQTGLSNAQAGAMNALANPVSREDVQKGMADQQGLVSRGLVQGRTDESGEEISTKAKDIAQSLQTKLDNGEELSKGDVKRLIREINKESNANEQSLERARVREVGKSLNEGSFVEETGLNLEQQISKQKDSALESRSREKARAILGENASDNEVASVTKVVIGTANSSDIDTVLTKPSLKNAIAEIVNEGADANSKIQIPINNAEARTVLENLTAVKGIANRNAILKETQEENAEDIKALLTNLNSGAKDLFANHLAEGRQAIGDVYQNRFYRLFSEGTKENADFDDAYKRLITPLGADVEAIFTPDFARQIFAQGKASVVAENAKATAKSLADKYANRTSGLTFEDNDKSLISESDKKGLEVLAKAGDVEIRVMKNLTATDKDGKALLTKDGKKLVANGMYHDGIIYISANTKNKLVTVAKHELTHYIKEMSPERYKELEDFVLKKWYKNDPVAMAKRIEEYQRLYKDATPEEAREELIADASEAFFTDEATIEEAVSFSKKLGKAIHDGIKHILDAFTGDTRGYRGYGDFMKDLGILQEAERMWLEALEDTQQRKKNARGNATAEDYVDASTQYTTSDEKHSLVESDDEIEKLNSEPTQKSYRAMALIDGKLYPPMATRVKDGNGKWVLQQGADIGQWIKSDITTDHRMFNSKGQFLLKKDNGGSPLEVAYNPYIHSSDVMLNDQFASAHKRPNLVVVEGEIPRSELENGKRAEHDLDDGRHIKAKDPTGTVQWKAGVVQSDLTGTRTVFLTNHFKPTRVVPDSEVARSIQKMVAGTDVVIPYNVVTPSLRQELQKLGVKMEQSKQKGYQVDLNAKYSVSAEEDQAYMDAVNRGDMETAQRMVDDYAKKMGYTLEGYHGTSQKTTSYSHLGVANENDLPADKRLPFTVFRTGLSGGIYVATNKEVADGFSSIFSSEKGTVFGLYVKFDNPLVVNEHIYDQVPRYYNVPTPSVMKRDGYTQDTLSTEEISHYAQEHGYDGVIIESVREGGDVFTDDYIAFSPNQLKLADPVTYDDEGNVIPLSQRFNENNEDIRYSITEGGYDGRSMSNRARRAYKNGEKPMSKWTKAEIIDAVYNINPDIDVSKLSAKVLRDNFLRQSSWHHTGKFYNRTNFYSVNEDFVEGLTQTDIDSLKSTGALPTRATRDYVGEYKNSEASRKQRQFDILQEANPMLDSYHTGIRSVDDIKSFEEVKDGIWDEIWKEYGRESNEHTSEYDPAPDYTFEDMREASSTGKVTVYSSKPIVNGTFVTPSMMEAVNYSGDGNFYQAEVPLEDVAWIDALEGQYAKIGDTEVNSEPRFSVSLLENPAPKPFMAKKKNDITVGEKLFMDSNGNPLLASGIEITSDTMRMMGKESEIPVVRRFLKRMARFMEKMGETYTFIGIDDVDNAKLEMRYDKDGKPVSIVVSAMVKNGEYPINFDFSSICKKRQAVSKLFEELSKSENGENFLDTVELTQENLFEINRILSENGYETACLGCFVETKRYNIEDWADGFIEKWNNAVKAVNPNAGYFDFASSKDIDYGYVSDEIDRFAENKQSEKEKESNRRKRERSNWKKKWLKDNPSSTEAQAEKAFKEWWKKKYNKNATDYKESWFENPTLSNDKQIVALVNSGEKMQKLLRKTDLISPKGLKALMSLHSDFYGVLYGHYGSGTPKPMVSFTPYNSELALLDRKMGKKGVMKNYTKEENDKVVNDLIEIGGVRVQSFSDFLIQNVFDYIQMIADMSARDFPAHAYTKEIAFARIFGLTGMKINLSVMFDVDPDGIAYGLDKDGNYVIADRARQEREKKKGNHVFQFSIPYDEAVKLQNQKGYDGNVGIIGVGLSDLHIRKMLNDPNIKMIIPYHASGMPAVIKQLTRLGVDADYTSTQNTLDITKIERDGVDVTKQFGKEYMLNLYKEKGSWKEAFIQFRKDTEGCNITTKKAFNSVGDFPLYTGDSVMSLDVTNDPKRTAEYYMGWCIEQGHFPLFYQFADEENYYKVLYDFNVYHNDGTYAPQQAVTNTYPNDLSRIISHYMNKANNFEQAQMPKWGKTIDETKKMLRANSYKNEARASVSEVEDSEYGRLQKENETLKEAVWKRNEQISAERMRAEMDVQRERRRGTERKRKAVNETRERYEARINDLKEQQKERERKAKERREEAERKQKEHRKQVHERASARRRASEERARQERQEQREARREKKQDSEARTRLLNIARRLDRIKGTDEFNRIRDQLIGNLDLEAKSMTGKTKMKLEDLEKWYQDQVENNDWFVKNERLEKKFERLRKTHISDMSLEDVQNLTEILLMLEHKVRNDKKLINSQYKKDVFMASFETAEGIKQSKGLKFKGLHKADNIFIGQVLSPIRYMRRLTGYDEDNPLMIATRELQKGEIASLDYRRRALEPFLKFTDMKFTSYLNGNKAPEIEVNATTIDMKPTTVKITPAIRIWFYLSSMNADNMRHIVNGGVRIPDVKLLKKGKRTDAYDNGTLVRFSKSQVQAIIDGMTSKEEAYAKAVFNYFNKVAPEATNAVSETLDGISIAKVKNYVPIHVDDTFLDVEGDTIKMDGTVEGMGSHKERVQSSKPAYAEDVSDLLMRSIDADMKYVGMAIPLRNFGKIYRSSSMESARGQAEHIELTGETNNSPSTLVYGDEQTATYRTRTGGYVSVRDAIRSLWTSDATKYIDKFLSDLQFPHSQVGEVERTLRELTSNYAGAVLTLNASVAIKQSASYPTAGAVLGWKPLIKAFTKVGKLDLDYANSVTPLLAYRAEGFNFREAGDIQNRDGRDSWFKRIMRTPLFNWIQGMDLLTTRKLFKASEIYVQDKYHLKRGQSGYDEKVAEIFNKVITETQPNYTVMERAGHLRSDSTLERTLSMFKTQPYQNFNIWYDATGDYLDKRDAYKKAKTKANREALKEASVNLGNATTSQIAQLAVFAVMTSLWALARGKDDKWRDEEGNLSFASYLKQLAHDMIGGVASEFFLGSDVFSALDSVINDSYYSGFSSVTDSSINDFFNTGMDMTKLLQQAWDYAVKGNEEEIDTDKLLKQMEKVVTEGGRFSGIPTGNLINLKNLMYRWVCVSKDGEYIGEYEAMKMSFAKDTYKKELLKRAYRNDKKAYEELRQMMIDDGMKESTLDKYINDSARENPTEEQTNSYKRSLTFLEGNRLWYNNDSVYIEDYDNALRDIALGIDTDDTDRLKKLESVGISPEENVLIRLAMEKADILYGDKNGTLNKDEKLQALEMVRSSLTLTDKEKEEILKTSFSFGKGKKKS